MRLEDLLYLPTRILYSGLWILTSAYCLLAFVPFTYHAVLQADLIHWLPLLAKLHSALFWFSFTLAGVTLLPHLRDANRRGGATLFMIANAVLGLLLVLTPLLQNLQNSPQSYYLALACLAPPVWLARLDSVRFVSAVRWSERSDGGGDWRILIACVAAAISLWFAQVVGGPGGATPALALGTAAEFALTFCAAFLALLVVRGLAAMHGDPARAEWFYLKWLAAIVVTVAMRDLVLPNISFTGLLADGYSLAAGYALSRVASVTGLWAAAIRGRDEDDGLAVYFEGLMPGLGRFHAAWAVLAVGAAWLSVKAPPLMAPFDWNDMLRKLVAAICMGIVLAACHGLTRGAAGPPFPSVATLAIGLLGLGPFLLLRLAPEKLSAADMTVTLDEHAASTATFGLLHERLQPASEDGGEFYKVLELNTNLPTTVQLSPQAIDLVDGLKPAGGKLPHIFILVVDSLRPDYLSPYNPAVTFTPGIDALAKESIVFRNAFSRFGGTALSEPSIWMGGVSIHKHYVQPFAPLNALEKLLAADEYEQHITRDTIIRQIVQPSARTRELDRGIPEHNLDLCKSLGELEGRLGGLAGSSRRMFVYTQSQTMHISTINREGRSVIDGGDYSGFDAPYASRLKRVDGCVAKFTEALKRTGLFEDSVVILTADHGDSLGEEGRWGHAFSIDPEVLRVPLIMHLPQRYLRQAHIDLEELVYTADITPTLYWMLGHGLPKAHELFGRPLLAPTREEHDRYLRDWDVVVSSYGPVYGVIDRTRQTLYLADGKNETETFYDLNGGFLGTKMRVTEKIRQESRARIQEHLASLNAFYGFDPATLRPGGQAH